MKPKIRKKLILRYAWKLNNAIRVTETQEERVKAFNIYCHAADYIHDIWQGIAQVKPNGYRAIKGR
jgi:hypothetical protein